VAATRAAFRHSSGLGAGHSPGAMVLDRRQTRWASKIATRIAVMKNPTAAINTAHFSSNITGSPSREWW
jgi:hypothetical protein